MVRNPKNIELYNKARELRKQGLSYRDISKRCVTSKSNISLWCKEIKIKF
jgi:transcriptional regulator